MAVSSLSAVLRGLNHHPPHAPLFFNRDDGSSSASGGLLEDVPQIATTQQPGQTLRRDEPSRLHARAKPAANQWANWLDEQLCTPAAKTHPASLAELVSVVTSAAAGGQRVRAVGAGHSMSDVARTDGAVLVYMDKLAAAVAYGEAGQADLVRVQAGIPIKQLNALLDGRGLALTHMGAYDGQTLAGAFSTGTHGSGAAFGPMSDMIRAVVLVAEDGTVYQIEPGSAGALTDPAKFAGNLPEAPGVPVVLKQDDDWFRAAQASVGCLGVIYSYTIEVTPAFNIAENRTATKWEAVKAQFAPELWTPLPAPLATFDHFELVISPYAESDGTHSLIWTERSRVGTTPRRGERQDFAGRIFEDLGILITPLLDDILNVRPDLVRSSINTALDNLVNDDAPYIDKSFKVYKQLDSELELKAHAIELHFPAQNLVATIDRLLEAFKNAAEKKDMFIAGPIGIRFTAPAQALLAPETGRLTATAELANIVGIDKGVELLREVKAEVCGADRSIRVHWGLDLDTATPQDARDWYGENLDKWLAVYGQLNSKGMFNNKFTERLGFSTPSA